MRASKETSDRADANHYVVFQSCEWDAVSKLLRLSPRELQIVQLVFRDFTDDAIAQSLQISVHTVHTYIGRIYRKLDIRSRTQLIIVVFETYLKTRNDTEVSLG